MIHPGANVDDTVDMHSTCRVWFGASVVRGARLGENCSVAINGHVDGAILGDGCIIGVGASVNPGCWLADRVFIGPNAVLCNDAFPRAHKDGFDLEALMTRPTIVIQSGASIGAGSVVVPGVVIGRNAMVAANAVVTADVPADMIWLNDGQLRPIDEERAKQRVRYADCGNYALGA